MSTEVIVALIGLSGVIIGAIPTYLFMRQKNLAEVEKLKAETEKIKAEAEKIREEIQSDKATSKNTKVRILFVAANPILTTRLRLDKEVRDIKEGLRKSSAGNCFELEQIWGVRWDDLRSHLLRDTPDILHISGHGKKEGIILEDDIGVPHLVSVKVLNNLLILFKDKIRLLIINTEYSKGMCKALALNFDYVIGSSNSIKDTQACKFSAAFYEALANSKDIKTAFEVAQTSIDDEYSPGRKAYQLFTSSKSTKKHFPFKT